MNRNVNYYEVLGISTSASQKEIDYAYIEMINVLNDIYPNELDGNINTDITVELVHEAYLVLGDEHSRSEYDKIYEINREQLQEKSYVVFLKKTKEFLMRRIIPLTLIGSFIVGGLGYHFHKKTRDEIDDLKEQIDRNNDIIQEQSETIESYKERLEIDTKFYNTIVNLDTEKSIYEESISSNMLASRLSRLQLYIDNPIFVEYIESVQREYRDHNIGYKIEKKRDEDLNYYIECNLYQQINLKDGREIKIQIATIRKYTNRCELIVADEKVTNKYIFFADGTKTFTNFNYTDFSVGTEIQYLPNGENNYLSVICGEDHPIKLVLQQLEGKNYLTIENTVSSQTLEINDYTYNELLENMEPCCQVGDSVIRFIILNDDLIKQAITSLPDTDIRANFIEEVIKSIEEVDKNSEIISRKNAQNISLTELDSSLIDILSSNGYIEGDYLTSEVKTILRQVDASYKDEKIFYDEFTEAIKYINFYVLEADESGFYQYKRVFAVESGFGLTLISLKEKEDLERFSVHYDYDDEFEYYMSNYNENNEKVYIQKNSCDSCQYSSMHIYYPKDKLNIELYKKTKEETIYTLTFSNYDNGHEYKISLKKQEFDKLFNILDSYCKYGEDTYNFIKDNRSLMASYIDKISDIDDNERQLLFDAIESISEKSQNMVLSKKY